MGTTLLAIETSCDETGIAVLEKREESINVLAQTVASQVDIHKETGGVIPEVAAREHTQVFRPLLEKVLREAGVSGSELDGIAVTVGPGLQPALAVGVTAARTLSYGWGIPLVPVHHIEGHIYSALLVEANNAEKSKVKGQRSNDGHLLTTHYSLPPNSFPALALIVSGGHTMLVLMKKHLQYEVLGSTRDDAAGEVFDKVARMLGLPYPGGPAISALAEQGDFGAFDFPRPMADSPDLDFSFSGLKTAVYYAVRDFSLEEADARKADVAASLQKAVVDSLISKVIVALEQTKPAVLLLAGGVAANQLLRREIGFAAQRANVPLRIAPLHLCGDNAVMIGQAGVFAFEHSRTVAWQEIDAYARIELDKAAPNRLSVPAG